MCFLSSAGALCARVALRHTAAMMNFFTSFWGNQLNRGKLLLFLGAKRAFNSAGSVYTRAGHSVELGRVGETSLGPNRSRFQPDTDYDPRRGAQNKYQLLHRASNTRGRAIEGEARSAAY